MSARRDTDETLEFLRKFVDVFEELLRHDGYGDLSVSVSLQTGDERRVVLRCGKEYQFTARAAGRGGRARRFRIVSTRNEGADRS